MRPYEYGDELADEEYVLALYRVAVRIRTGRSAGPAAGSGPLERYADGGAMRAVLRRLGARSLPTLVRYEPDIDDTTRIKGSAVAALVREIEQVDLARLPEGERALLRVLLDWGRRASAENGALRISIDGPV
ncbi:hypothetical protein GCM10018790_11790 [Kitasatospora xanthocidica]|uniref:hypothetical protein n=1 Tax=Kitasatospora xanthocidica TaxID=83382 RepID=UPI00167901F3|nr:hypothetical protein [Kitasatospora xanthocidica]GHF35577.1 hypothetical protein GCM10018790_11790 [Kitasatospora xanthocidica]